MAQGSGLRAQGELAHSQKLLSVIIPAYNVEKFLIKCVESVVNQTYKNLEIIIVDDGSKDSTPQICDELANKYNNIKIIHKANQGTSKARQTAFNASRGEYITFVDSDDYIDLNAYEEAVKALENNNCDLVSFGAYWVDLDGEILSEWNRPTRILETPREIYAYFSSLTETAPLWSLWDKVYKRSLFENNFEWPDITSADDYYINAQTYANAKKFMTLNKKFYYYVKNPNSIVNVKISRRRYENLVKVYDLTINFTAKTFPEFLPEALYRKIEITQHVFSSYLNLRGGDKHERKEILKQSSKLMREDLRKLNSELKSQGRELDKYNFKARIYLWMNAHCPRFYEFYLTTRLKIHELTGI